MAVIFSFQFYFHRTRQGRLECSGVGVIYIATDLAAVECLPQSDECRSLRTGTASTKRRDGRSERARTETGRRSTPAVLSRTGGFTRRTLATRLCHMSGRVYQRPDDQSSALLSRIPRQVCRSMADRTCAFLSFLKFFFTIAKPKFQILLQTAEQRLIPA